jgi:predicted N-formylglutamate amidohydrolase
LGTLLYDYEEPSYIIKNQDGSSPLFLTCDHASYSLPKRLGDLGVATKVLFSHAGWDIGALQVSERLSEALDAPLLHTRFSRLVIDCNRPLDAFESVPTRIHGHEIPGNQGLTPGQIELRVNELFVPYHKMIEKQLERHIKRKGKVYYLAVHSFTPVLNDQRRPWPIGITYENTSIFASFLINELEKTELKPVGVNEPYPITRDGDYGMHAHGSRENVDAVLIEIRQDLLQEESSADSIIAHLIEILDRFFLASVTL